MSTRQRFRPLFTEIKEKVSNGKVQCSGHTQKKFLLSVTVCCGPKKVCERLTVYCETGQGDDCGHVQWLFPRLSEHEGPQANLRCTALITRAALIISHSLLNIAHLQQLSLTGFSVQIAHSFRMYIGRANCISTRLNL